MGKPYPIELRERGVTSTITHSKSGFWYPERSHDGKVVMMRSNLRWGPMVWSSPAGTAKSSAHLIDASDREIIAWQAVIPGSELP